MTDRQLVARGEQTQRVRVLPLRIAGRKVGAEIALRARAEQSVADRVRQHVGIAVAERALLERDPHAAEDERPAFDQAMDVETMTDAGFRLVHQCCRSSAEGMRGARCERCAV